MTCSLLVSLSDILPMGNSETQIIHSPCLSLFLSKPTVSMGQSFSSHRQVPEIYAMDMETVEQQLIIFLRQTLKTNHSSETLKQAFKSLSKYNILNFRFWVTNNVTQPTFLLTTARKVTEIKLAEKHCYISMQIRATPRTGSNQQPSFTPAHTLQPVTGS